MNPLQFTLQPNPHEPLVESIYSQAAPVGRYLDAVTFACGDLDRNPAAGKEGINMDSTCYGGGHRGRPPSGLGNDPSNRQAKSKIRGRVMAGHQPT